MDVEEFYQRAIAWPIRVRPLEYFLRREINKKLRKR